jgi:hypothetical protein
MNCRGPTVLAIGVAVAGLATTATAAAWFDPPVPGDVRTCATRGDSSRPARPPASGAITVGPLVIWPTVRDRTQRTADARWRYVTKAPVLVRARARVTLSVAPWATALAGLWRNHGGGYVSAVRFAACRERQPSRTYRGTVGRFTMFPFTFALIVPSACVPMDVWVDGESGPRRIVVPVGRASC